MNQQCFDPGNRFCENAVQWLAETKREWESRDWELVTDMRTKRAPMSLITHRAMISN